MSDLKYLQKRGDQWHYIRRVPKRYRGIDTRGTIRRSLGTDSLQKARQLRNAQVEEEDRLWKLQLAGLSDVKHEREEAIYEKAKLITDLNELDVVSIEALAGGPLENILKRLKLLETGTKLPAKEVSDAILGVIDRPSIPISKAFDMYCEKIASGQLVGKSVAQRKAWHKAKLRAITNFISMHGDLPMDKISREHARDFFDWWSERLSPDGDGKALAPNTANRDLGNLRKLYRKYWEYQGEEDRKNPFRNMRFSGKQISTRPHFEDDWVRNKILVPNIFDGLNEEAKMLIYAMIETGCRPSELANIHPENICLNEEVPHIRIRFRPDRQLKAQASERDIPLVGISLLAMQRSPDGFPRYRDKDALLSASLMKAFRARKLFPTPEHKIYSFRHSFEQRMLEADIDYGLRCILMGHKNTRPMYGDGGSLKYRRDQLIRIMHQSELVKDLI